MTRVFLIPGFFGFSTIGKMRYFAHVHRELGAALARRGVEATLHDVATLPTASLQRRAARLAEVATEIAEPSDELHLVGHSTGGLDARMLVSPDGGVAEPAGWAELAPRVRSVVSVASPHEGAPIASFFATVQGERWLRLLSILTLHVVRLGEVGTAPIGVLLGAVSRAGSISGVDQGLLDDVWKDVLRDFDEGRRDELRGFFQEVWRDRALLGQLTPEGLRRVSDALTPRTGVRYGSVALRARPPGEAAGVILPVLRPSNQLYRLLHGLAGWSGSEAPPRPDPADLTRMSRSLGRAPTARDNDAIVPTLSQLHGELIAAAVGDHLDVLGYFRGPLHRPPHVDWLRTKSDFGRREFAAVWDGVAGFIAGRAGA